MARLRRTLRDGSSLGYALAGWQRRIGLDMIHQQVEGSLCMRLDNDQLRKQRHVALDVIAVLHFVESVLRVALVIVALARGIDRRLVGTRLGLDRQQGVHGARHRNQGLLDLPGGLESLRRQRIRRAP